MKTDLLFTWPHLSLQPERRKTYSNKIRFLLNNNIFCAHIWRDAFLFSLSNNKKGYKTWNCGQHWKRRFPQNIKKCILCVCKSSSLGKFLFFNFFKNIVFKNFLCKHPVVDKVYFKYFCQINTLWYQHEFCRFYVSRNIWG